MDKNIYTDGTYWRNMPNYHLGDSYWKAKNFASLLTSYPTSMMLSKKASICEVGCGAGGVLHALIEALKEKGIICSGYGYDISSQAIAKACSLFPDCTFMVSDIKQIERKFDILLLCDILEHLAFPKEILSHCLSISNLTVIHLPLDYHFWGMLLRGKKKYFEYLKNDRGHIHFFTKSTAIRLVESVGGEILDWKYTKWGIEHCFDNSKSGKTIRILRRIGFNINMDYSVRLFGGASIAIICRSSGFPQI